LKAVYEEHIAKMRDNADEIQDLMFANENQIEAIVKKLRDLKDDNLTRDLKQD